jgi:glycosyltransferase involved in cell wall biosynthesis
MGTRLRVLMSAYSCEPGKGSEPEVGWQWALQMAKLHDVTVVTRANNRPSIEPVLEELRGQQPLPSFVYHDCGRALLALKRRCGAVKLYYMFWQKSAREVVRRLHQARSFDLMHHTTFAAFRYPIATTGHGVPSVWGPVGGAESVPAGFLPWDHLPSLFPEVIRNLSNSWHSLFPAAVRRRARLSSAVLASTPEMKRVFDRLGIAARIMPTIGLNLAEIPFRPRIVRDGPLKILFVGNVISLKGIDLALEALALAGGNATFTLIGSGNYLETARRLAGRLGLRDRVLFRGRIPRTEVLEIYPDFDLFLFPSLHDTGGYALIEAMSNELPVVCLDCGGPAVAVGEGCGIKVPLGARQAVIRGLAGALRAYDENRPMVQAHGQAARRSVLLHYDWRRKALEMDAVYQGATAARPSGGSPRRAGPPASAD